MENGTRGVSQSANKTSTIFLNVFAEGSNLLTLFIRCPVRVLLQHLNVNEGFSHLSFPFNKNSWLLKCSPVSGALLEEFKILAAALPSVKIRWRQKPQTGLCEHKNKSEEMFLLQFELSL